MGRRAKKAPVSQFEYYCVASASEAKGKAVVAISTPTIPMVLFTIQIR